MSEPVDMAVVEIASPGGPEVLRPARRPRPVPGAGEVLIAVAAAGVHRPDVPQRQGRDPRLPGGVCAECALAAAPVCLPVPDGLTLQEAAALPETFFTVWHNVFERGRLAAGETLLVHGGSSGIGTAARPL